MTGYASLAAFLAHWHALARKHDTNQESALLAEMNRTVQEILGDDSRYLKEPATDSAAQRHRGRAETRLRRELIARGTISG